MEGAHCCVGSRKMESAKSEHCISLMIPQRRIRHPVVVVAVCAILAISAASFLRLNLYLIDIDILGASDEKEMNTGIVNISGVDGGMIELGIGHRHVNTSETNRTLYKHNNTHYDLLQKTNNSLKILYKKTPKELNDDEAKEYEAEPVEWSNEARQDVFAKMPNITRFGSNQPSPACRPNLDLALLGWKWDNATRFERIYFYHVRKAGGTSLAKYFKAVANYHGLMFKHMEYKAAEEPGSSSVATFYITHLREPVDRSLSHFRYQGRWACIDLSQWRNTPNHDWAPTRYNSKKIQTWNKTAGHVDLTCGSNNFSLHECAINCYTQWISGLSCPQYNITTNMQYEVANARLRRYNFVVILEKLKDPGYVNAMEQFFGVKGVTKKRGAFCEKASHNANTLNPINITNETRHELAKLNQVDLRLYNDLMDCGEKSHDFGKQLFGSRVKSQS